MKKSYADEPVTIRLRTWADGDTGWEAVTIAAITTTHTIGRFSTPEDCESVVHNMMRAGMMDERPVVVIR